MSEDSMPTLRGLIDELTRARVPLERIEEDVIEPARLDHESRAALWLHAWHGTDGAYHPPTGRTPERPPLYVS
jgi:hypothetical protein